MCEEKKCSEKKCSEKCEECSKVTSLPKVLADFLKCLSSCMLCSVHIDAVIRY